MSQPASVLLRVSWTWPEFWRQHPFVWIPAKRHIIALGWAADPSWKRLNELGSFSSLLQWFKSQAFDQTDAHRQNCLTRPMHGNCCMCTRVIASESVYFWSARRSSERTQQMFQWSNSPDVVATPASLIISLVSHPQFGTTVTFLNPAFFFLNIWSQSCSLDSLTKTIIKSSNKNFLCNNYIRHIFLIRQCRHNIYFIFAQS